MVGSRSWSDFALVLRQHELMDAMLERLGIDAVAALRHGEAFIRARANCRSCHCVGACRQWFLEEPEGAAEFCPNFGFFNQLKGP